MPAGTPVMLSDAIQEFLTYRRSAGYEANTVQVNARSLSKLLALIGNIQVRHLEAHHGEIFQAHLMGKGYKPNTVNSHLTSLHSFTKWLRSRRYIGGGSDPTANTRFVRAVPEPKQRIEAKEFDRYLDACPKPHERIVNALGLYLFLRASEIQTLRVGDVDLERGEIYVRIQKSKVADTMPICQELDAELRRWLTWYAEDIQQPLTDDMFLVPARRRPIVRNDTGRGGCYTVERSHHNCVPHRPCMRLSRYVQRSLTAFGIRIRDDQGKSLREGVHTLRRSGARALFDELVDRGSYDGVLRYVSAMLHHKSTIMTERYLGLDVDVKKRNDLLRGRRMFTSPEEVIAASDNITRMVR